MRLVIGRQSAHAPQVVSVAKALMEEALAALDKAVIETNGPERYRLLGEAVRLHRLALDALASEATDPSDAAE